MRAARLAALLFPLLSATGYAQAAADRVIDGAIPVWSAQLTASVAIQIARLAKVPLGVEAIPRNPSAPLLPVSERRDLQGMRVGEALDWLTRIDPVYRWTEIDGVIVIRPAAAWDDPDHFLHRVVGHVDIQRRDAWEVLAGVGAFLRTGTLELPLPAAERALVTVSLRDATALALLNASAREATLVWEIDYGGRTAGKSSLWLRAPAARTSGSVELPYPVPSWVTQGHGRVAAATTGDRLLDRTIEGVLTQTRNHLESHIIFEIGKYAGVPIGLESLPVDPDAADTRLLIEQQIVLTGLTVREALDAIVDLDPRYHWVESRGVIVVRPTFAWGDPEHFLNTVVDPLSVQERDFSDVLVALSDLLETGKFSLPIVPRPVWLPVTFSTTAPTGMMEILNEMARTGSLNWSVRYGMRPDRFGNTVSIGMTALEPLRRGGTAVHLPLPYPRWLRRRN